MKKFKMLYLSCHSIHEYDEVKLFKEMGIDVFSHGAFADPNVCGDGMRPPIGGERDDELIELAKANPKEAMSKQFIDRFDVIVDMHTPTWITQNWGVLRNKIVIWRTNGQSTGEVEQSLAKCRDEGMRIVRYSPIERHLPNFIGEDAMIRFYKDPDEFAGWTGEIPRIINVVQNMKERRFATNYDVFEKVTAGLPRKIYGPHNESFGKDNGGCVGYERLKEVMRKNRVFFYTGTHPASYTLGFIEAFMTGIPIVAVGPGLGNPQFLPGQYSYEIPGIIENGKDGLWADDPDQLRQCLELLLKNKNAADYLSKNGREKAIMLFGKDKIKREWESFFTRLLGE
jgi:glycosyltransferase involved in cell wall biosynthesis